MSARRKPKRRVRLAPLDTRTLVVSNIVRELQGLAWQDRAAALAAVLVLTGTRARTVAERLTEAT